MCIGDSLLLPPCPKIKGCHVKNDKYELWIHGCKVMRAARKQKRVTILHLGQRVILYSHWMRRMRSWQRHENIMLLKSGLTPITYEKENSITQYNKITKTTTQPKSILTERRLQLMSGMFRKRVLLGRLIASRTFPIGIALCKEGKAKNVL